MSNWMDTARTWLGLGNDAYYDDEYGDPGYDDPDDQYDEPDDDYVEEAPAVRPVGGRSAARPVRSVASSRQPEDWEDNGDGGVRVISQPEPEPEPAARGVVRPLPTSAKPHVVSPSGFNDVQQVADRFKRDQPVIINLQGVDRDLSRRLIDFASGLCYGLEGDMERVADQVFLLTPRGAEVSDDDRRRLREGGLVDEGR